MIDLQPASRDIYDSKYRLRDMDGSFVDSCVEDTFSRVAHALADVEETGEKRALWYDHFFWAMRNGAIPAGRILSNAGAGAHKPNVSLINCLSGETPVMTRSGIFPIRSLAGKTVEILNGNGDWVMAPFKSFGVQKVYPLVWRWGDNKRNTVTVKATADHRWILSGGRTVTTEYWLSGGVDGRYTIPHLRPPKIDEDEAEYCEGLVHGAIFGDGSQYQGYAHLNLCEKKREITDLFSGILGIAPNHYVINGVDVDRFHIKTDINYKAIPFGCSESYLKGFFSGLLATDGSVTQSGRGCEVTVYGQLDLIEFLEERIPYIGHSTTYRRLMGKKGQITNYGTRNKDVWTLGIHPSSLEASDFVRKSQRDKHRITTNGIRTSAVWRLVSVGEEFTEEEVFCCHEPITTSFAIFNGMMTGQCVVSSTIEDSMHSILDVLKDAGMLLKAGCGVGYCFSTLRPKGSRVAGAGATTSGPLPFMDVYDKLCSTISSAGGRRGAQMATFDIGHPDVMEFVRAKREDGRLRQFNLSLLVPDAFMATLERDGDWPLSFGGTVHRTVKARHLWELVMASTYDYAEPGVLFVDRINEMNNLYFCENIQAVNPCGEQNLPPAGSCLLGSIDLTRFVMSPFGRDSWFDWNRYRKVVAIFARMLDNVVEIANLPVKAYADELVRKRRHGMGYFGLGSAMAMLGMRYGDDRSLKLTDEVTRTMAHENWKQALELSLEKGPAPIMEETFEEHGGARGKHLHAMSRYMDKIRDIDPGLVEKLNRHGARFSHATSCAPTGTISLSVGNNASNGIEPSFAHEYSRNVIVAGKKSKESVQVRSLEALVWRELHGDEPMPDHCVTADQISPEDHIAVQAEAQKWIDSSISKCVAAGTPIITNYGVLPIEELGYASVAGEFGNALDGLEVLDADGEWKLVTSHYYAGQRDTVRLWLSNGQSVEGSQVHRLLDASGNWKRLSDFDVGDGVRSRVLDGFVLAGGKSLPPCVQQAPNAKPVIFPASMTPDLAKWLGMWCANGSANPNVVSLTDGSSEIIALWRDLSVSLFGRVTSCIVKDSRSGVFTAQIGSRALSEWLRGWAGSKAAGKFVPRQILGGSREEMLAFVSGLSLDGYRRKSHTVLYDGKSKALADGVFSMCAMLGLCPRRGEKTVSGYGYSTYYVSVKGFCSCLEDHKNTPEVSDRRNLAPLPSQWSSFHPATDHPSYSAWRNIRQEDRMWTHPDVLGRCGMDDLSGVEVLTVKRVERGCCDLYDIEVDGSHSYLIDGVISHNTINVPSDISFERFKDIYTLAYKSGLKGCSTFRFNPERFQGVLVKESDLKNTVYRFYLDSGDSVEFRGDETVEYEGELHTAANLFDAIKEGYYGKL